MAKNLRVPFRFPFRFHFSAAGIVVFCLSSLAHAQKEYRYQNEFSTGGEARDRFGNIHTHNQMNPKLDGTGFRFEMGTKLECGKIDVAANIQGQFQELQTQLSQLVPKNTKEATDFLKSAAMVTVCYAYPTICAQLRNDWLSIMGKLNLRSQACAAVDKFIDNQADKGARQLQSEALAQCVHRRSQSTSDVAAALSFCQTNPDAGLVFRDFQSGVMNRLGDEKQRVLKSLLSFAKDETSYDFLSSFLGEIQVGTDGGFVPLFEKGMLRPYDVSDAFLTQGQRLVCGSLAQIFKGQFVAQGLYETQAVQVIQRKLNPQTFEDLRDLSPADKQIACLALGRAVGKEAGLKAASHLESTLSTGLLNTAIPESLRVEYRDRALSSFPAMRQALAGENIPSVEQVRWDLSEFAKLQRSKTRILASQTNRAKLKNAQGDGQNALVCTDSLNCN